MTDTHTLCPTDDALEAAALRALADGPLPADRLAACLRRRFPGRSTDSRLVEMLVERSTVLIGRPDGTVIRLIDLLEGSVFTQRVAHADGARRDLWSTLALAPLVVWLVREGLCLESGEPLACGEFGHDTIIGPKGWLPQMSRGSLVSLTVTRGRIAAAVVADDALIGPSEEGAVRRSLSRHYRTAAWWTEEDLAERPYDLTSAVANALVEDPSLLRRPTRPLDELLHIALRRDEQDHHLRDAAAWNAGECVSFGITGMPEALHREIERRARHYGMSSDQYAILALGHLCWRTPFAEDLGDDDWGWEPVADRPARPARSPHLRGV